MSTLAIVFAPKVIAIYKDASGLLAQRISDSKASASDIASRNATMGRGIKDLAQQPIRLMDRTTLRTYTILLEKELTMARAALATLDANEGVLAGGGGHGYRTIANQPGTGGNLSANNSRGDGNAGVVGFDGRAISGFTPAATTRTLATTPRAATMLSPNAPAAGVASSGSRPYVATGNMSPKGGPQQQRGEVPGMIRAGSTMFNKYNLPSGASTPVLNASPPPNGATILVATLSSANSSSSIPGVRSTASIAPLNTNVGSATSMARAISPAIGSTTTIIGSGRTSHLSTVELKALPGSPSISGGLNDNNDEFTLPPTTVPSTRFRMPGSGSLGLGGTSHAGGPLSPIAPSPAGSSNNNGGLSPPTATTLSMMQQHSSTAITSNPSEPLLSNNE
jgi:hypothetical protein